MLSTKDIQASSGKTPKTLKPGNTNAKILDISLQPLKSDPNAYYLMLHLEGEDQGPEFEGFLYSKDNPNLGRAKGQVGKVRYSMYPYRDGVTKGGKPKSRDIDILRSLVEIATLTNKRDEINNIESETIEEFVKTAAKIIASDKFYHFCIGGSAYIKDDGNKDFSLCLPKYDKNYKFFEPVGTTPSQVPTFDYTLHVEDKTESASKPEPTAGWGGSSETKSEGWKPTGFNI
jgi:hypothetical protein